MLQSFDWSHLQTFVAVADNGSLTAAARSLMSSQPTVGRHVHALEQQLGVSLFTRTTQGLELTPTGLELLEHARDMAAAADRLTLAAEGRSTSLSGTVRITASEVIATYVLPDMLAAFHQVEPEIAVEVVATNQTDNLLQREADIALRMFRPTQNDVFTRKVADLEIGVYAAHDYLERRGEPVEVSEYMEHDFVGFDRDDTIIRGFRAAGIDVKREFFTFRSDDQVVCWRMVVAGYGIGFNQTLVGDAEPRVRRILRDLPLQPLPVWLTAHAELKTSLRVRRTFDFLADALGRHQQS